MLESRENSLSSNAEVKVTNLKNKVSSPFMSSSLKVGKICFPVITQSKSLPDGKGNGWSVPSFLSDHRPETMFEDPSTKSNDIGCAFDKTAPLNR